MDIQTEKGRFLILDLNNHLRLKILYETYISEKEYIEFNFGHFTARQKELSKNFRQASKVSSKKFNSFLKHFDKEFKKELNFINNIKDMENYYWSLIIESENSNFKDAGLLLLKSKGIECVKDLIIAKRNT